MRKINEAIFFGYGGMKFGQNTKLHVITNDGLVLCGVKSNWMEATYGQIQPDGFFEDAKHLFPITDERANTCKRCLTKWQSLNT